MKANEAPEKLYIISDEDGVMLSLDNATDLRGDRYDFVDEAVFPVKEGTFEYTRTDAFIEKACEFLNSSSILKDSGIVKKFKIYMKGE